MSWLFSQALVEAFSAATCSDGAPSAPSNTTPTPQAYLSPDRMKAFSRLSQFGMTFAPLTAALGEAVSMWCREDSRARTSARPEPVSGLLAKRADSGARWPGSLARYNRDSSLWRTHQLSLLEAEPTLLATLPRWGMTQDGELWALPTSAPRTSASACGSWPTLSANEARNGWQDRTDAIRGKQESLTTVLQRQMGRRPRAPWAGGHLSPMWAEWFMGFPEGWTDLGASVMPKYLSWLRSHGRF